MILSRVELLSFYFHLIDKTCSELELLVNSKEWIKMENKHDITIFKRNIEGDVNKTDVSSINKKTCVTPECRKSGDAENNNPQLQILIQQSQINQEISTENISIERLKPSLIHCIKGVGTIDAPAELIKNIIKNLSCASSWDPLFSEGKIIEKIDSHSEILHLKFSTTSCLFKCVVDTVILFHWYRKKDGSFVLVGRSIEHPECPPQKGCIRAEVLTSGYILTPMKENVDKTLCTYISHIDFKEFLDGHDFLKSKFTKIIQQKQPLNIFGLQKLVSKKPTSSN